MNIQSPNINKNYLLVKKRLFDLYELNSKENYNLPIKSNSKLTLSTNYPSKRSRIINKDKGNCRNLKQSINNFNTCTNSSVQSFVSKYCPNLKEYKKRLFLQNMLSIDKNVLLEDYMKKKELKLLKDKNKKNLYEARKTFFTDDTINDNRTSFYYKEKSFDKNNKYSLMIKDINSNYILFKNKNKNKNKEEELFQKLENERKKFKDFNKKFGIRNVYLKTDRVFNKNKTFMNNNCNFLSGVNYLNSFRSTNRTPFNQKRKNFILK
jgi:hypothetical protein